MYRDDSFITFFLPAFMSDGRKRGLWALRQHNTNDAKGSDPLYRKRGLFVLWMLPAGPAWGWAVGGGQWDEKEGASGPRLDQLHIKAEKENVFLLLWILEEFHFIEVLHFNLC